MCDDQARGRVATTQVAHVSGVRPEHRRAGACGVANEGHVFKIHAGLGLVEEDEARILGHELQQFGALDLAAGKPRIDVPVQELVVLTVLAMESTSTSCRGRTWKRGAGF